MRISRLTTIWAISALVAAGAVASPAALAAEPTATQSVTLNCHGARAIVSARWYATDEAEIWWKLSDTKSDGFSPALRMYASNPDETDPTYPFKDGAWPRVNRQGSGSTVNGHRERWNPSSFGEFENLEIFLENGTGSQGTRCQVRHRIFQDGHKPTASFNVSYGASTAVENWNPYRGRVMQSFGQDQQTGDIYVIGVHSDSGDTLPPGSMIVTRFNSTGQRQDRMVLERFGHGATMGVERRGEDVYLWTEADANPAQKPHQSYGRSVARFKYEPDTNLNFDDARSTIECLPPAPSSSHGAPRPVLDQKAQAIWIRWTLPGANQYTLRKYPLSAAAGDGCQDADSWQHTKQFTAPVRPTGGWPTLKSSQGTAIHNGHLYLLFGNSDGASTAMFSYRIGNSGKARLVQAAHALPYFNHLYDASGFLEPEGLAVIDANSDDAFLAPGFAHGSAGDRRVAIAKLPFRLGER